MNNLFSKLLLVLIVIQILYYPFYIKTVNNVKELSNYSNEMTVLKKAKDDYEKAKNSLKVKEESLNKSKNILDKEQEKIKDLFENKQKDLQIVQSRNVLKEYDLIDNDPKNKPLFDRCISTMTIDSNESLIEATIKCQENVRKVYGYFKEKRDLVSLSTQPLSSEILK